MSNGEDLHEGFPAPSGVKVQANGEEAPPSLANLFTEGESEGEVS